MKEILKWMCVVGGWLTFFLGWTIFLVVVVTLFGCGGYLPETSGHTSQGIRVLAEPAVEHRVDVDQVSFLVEETTKQFALRRGHLLEAVREVWASPKATFVIKFVEDFMYCPGADKRNPPSCIGLFYSPDYIEVRIPQTDPTCLPYTSISHEVVHLLAFHVEGDSNSQHDPELFYYAESPVRQAQSAGVERFCPWAQKR